MWIDPRLRRQGSHVHVRLYAVYVRAARPHRVAHRRHTRAPRQHVMLNCCRPHIISSCSSVAGITVRVGRVRRNGVGPGCRRRAKRATSDGRDAVPVVSAVEAVPSVASWLLRQCLRPKNTPFSCLSECHVLVLLIEAHRRPARPQTRGAPAGVSGVPR
jgi:hypothetical protein